MLVSKPQAEAWFGLFRFRSPLLTESRLLSFHMLTEMFQFGRFALTALYIQAAVTQKSGVSTFGDLHIKAWLPAP